MRCYNDNFKSYHGTNIFNLKGNYKRIITCSRSDANTKQIKSEHDGKAMCFVFDCGRKFLLQNNDM